MVAKKPAATPRGAQRAGTTRRTPEGRFTSRPTSQRNSSSHGSRKGVTAASLIGGLGIGAALMYLLDPEAGQRRRQMLTETAGDAIGAAGETLGSAWETASEKARDISANVAEHASELAGTASEKLRPYQRSGRRWLRDTRSSVGDSASSWLDGAREYLSPAAMMSSARSVLPHHRRQSHTAGIAGAVGCLALGFGAMYLMDPDRGRARRAVVRDKSVRYMNEIGEFFNRTGRHLSNRAKGLYAESRSMVRPGEVTDLQLSERVRSALGRVGTGAGSVAIESRDGIVTLSGRCACADEAEILGAVRAVRGVSDVVNNIEVSDRQKA